MGHRAEAARLRHGVGAVGVGVGDRGDGGAELGADVRRDGGVEQCTELLDATELDGGGGRLGHRVAQRREGSDGLERRSAARRLRELHDEEGEDVFIKNSWAIDDDRRISCAASADAKVPSSESLSEEAAMQTSTRPAPPS